MIDYIRNFIKILANRLLVLSRLYGLTLLWSVLILFFSFYTTIKVIDGYRYFSSPKTNYIEVMRNMETDCFMMGGVGGVKPISSAMFECKDTGKLTYAHYILNREGYKYTYTKIDVINK